MTTEPLDEQAIFEAARKLHSHEAREAYLQQACGDDAVAGQRIRALLKAYEEGASFLEAPAAVSADTIAEPSQEFRGAVIGPYKLIEQIGEGGMGTVWMAQQTEPVKRMVAVKFIKAGMDSKQIMARFEAERQALALMDHPNIAKVLDGGTTGEPSRVSNRAEEGATRRLTPLGSLGGPYFVMDLVKGVPITKYCDEHHLTPRQRLELFIPVCQAIQHAHQKGIIHRDLKPSNVLVALYDGKPVPKVIDFGVAKAAGQSLTEKTLVTGFGAVVGTLEYMSPEQAETNQLDIDTRSDIYSLGVLLYELLTGSPPFSRKELQQSGMLEMLRVIREEEPSKPSTKLSSSDRLPSLAANRGMEPAKLTKAVRGELDWIVLKALEKDRNRRYESANAFALDVQRYLADEPVQACPPSVSYRFRKFARRNRRGLVTAALLVFALFLIVGTVAGSLGWATRDRAARQAAVEVEVRRALDESEQWLEQEKWPEALAAVQRGEGLLAGGGSSELRDRVHQLRKDLEMILRLEDIDLLATEVKNHRLDWDVVDQGYAKAFADYGIDVLTLPVQEAASRIHARPRLAIPLAVTLDDWASVQSSRTEADRARIRAVAGAVDPDPWRRQVREAVQNRDGKALAELADSPNLAQQPRNSLVVLKHGLRHGLRFHDLSDKSLEVLRLLQRQYPGDFWVNYWLADELNWNPHFDRSEAVSFARAALALRPKSAAAHLLLAIALHKKGKFDEAIVYHESAIELAPNYVFAHNELGWTLYKQGKLDDAIVCFQKASALDPKHAWPHFNLGNALRDQNKLEEAVASFRKAIDLDPKYAYAHHDLGRCFHLQGKFDDAIVCYRKAIDLDPKDVFAHSFLGVTLRDQNKLDEAIVSFRRVVEINPKVIWAQKDLGNALFAQGKVNEAVVCFRKAIALAAHADGHGRAQVGWSVNNAAWALATASNPEHRHPAVAVELAKEAVRLSPVGCMWNTLGAAHYRAGDYYDAVAALQQSMKLRHGGDSLDWFFLSMAYWQVGDKDKARQWHEKAVDWMEKNQPKNQELRRFRAEAEELMKKDSDECESNLRKVSEFRASCAALRCC